MNSNADRLSSGIDFTLTEEQQLIQRTVAEIAQQEFAPRAAEVDRQHRFPQENFELLAQSDLCGLVFPEKYGGAGLDYVSYAIAVEELARACATTAVMYSAHLSLCARPIYIYGTETQRLKFLVPLAQGTKLGAFALSEPGSGSDSAAAKCTAVQDGNHYILNGAKNWITNGSYADYYLVFAQSNAALKHKGLIALVIEKGTPGFTFGKMEDKLGIRGSATCQISFDNSPVPIENVLGLPGDGFEIAMSALDGGRIGIAAQAVGIAQGAWEHASRYAKERVAFGTTINQFQAIQFMLVEMATEIETARLLTYQASLAEQQGLNFTRLSATAKLYASETAMRNTIKCVQIFGGYGYVSDYPVERYMRDAKITEIYEGTSEIQRLVIAGNILKDP